MARPVFVLACVLALSTALRAQATDPDAVSALLDRVEQTLTTSDRSTFPSLFGPSVDEFRIRQLAADLFTPGSVRTVVRERDRAQLEGVPEGEGHRLVVEFFNETASRAKILTANVDVRRPPGGGVDSWRVVGLEGLTSVEGLHKLRVNTSKQLSARRLQVTSEDLVITLNEGTVFLVECDDGITGLVLLGRGEMRLSPAPRSERGQLRIFSGSETLNAPFEAAFVRINPSDYEERITTASLTGVSVQPRLARRAQEVFARESPKSFSLDLRDFSRNTWHLLPPAGDFLAEVDTRRYKTLTYAQSSAQAEDVSLFQRDHRRTIVLYPSVAKLAARGRFYSDDLQRDFDVSDYNIEVSVVPERQFIQGRARVALRVRGTSMTSLTLRLAESLAVTGITSVEFGPLLHLRIRNQHSILINLPRPAAQDSDLTLVITYAGHIPTQELDVDTVRVSRDGQDPNSSFLTTVTEPHFLLSNRSFWYPQNPVSDYATATLRITVPDGYGCVATGQPVPSGNVVSLRDLLTATSGTSFLFRADQPLRYLAFIVSRFIRVAERTIAVDNARPGADIDRVGIAVEANPRQQSRGRQIVGQMEDIMRFYSTLVGDAPYTTATVAVVESELPGGHSPGYFAVINDPRPNPNMSWRNDPAAFEGFPEFFLAHELAHQWWGQAVGWKNYHEQWLSEGFSQYFAALYAQKVRGDRTFNDMLRQFRRWALAESDQGPVHLGYRVGHIKSDLRVMRAIVYNKGAAVLHMLRRRVGDEVFFSALRRFYADRRFQKAGTEDLERVFEAESGLVLDRFFERWIYGAEVPRVTYRTTIGDREVRVRFEQSSELVFDLPVTVTVVYADGRTQDTVVSMTQAHVEEAIPTDGVVREVQINRDSAAIAEFDEL